MNQSIAPIDQNKKEDDLVRRAMELMEDLVATAQGKSDFVLQNFVVNQHDTVPARKKQALLELQIRMFNIRRTQLTTEKIQAQIMEKEGEISDLEHDDSKNPTLRNAKIQIKHIEIEELRISLEEIDLARIGLLREAETLYSIVQKYPKYTQEEYQADELHYWMLRLGRQVMLNLKDTGRPGVGNADAIRMMEVPQDDDFSAWLKSFSEPTNSPADMINAVITTRMLEAEQRAAAMQAAKALQPKTISKEQAEKEMADPDNAPIMGIDQGADGDTTVQGVQKQDGTVVIVKESFSPKKGKGK